MITLRTALNNRIFYEQCCKFVLIKEKEAVVCKEMQLSNRRLCYRIKLYKYYNVFYVMVSKQQRKVGFKSNLNR